MTDTLRDGDGRKRSKGNGRSRFSAENDRKNCKNKSKGYGRLTLPLHGVGRVGDGGLDLFRGWELGAVPAAA